MLRHFRRDPAILLSLPPLASLALGALALPVVQEQYFLLALPYAAIVAAWALPRLLALLPALRRPALLALALVLLAGTARNLHVAFHRTGDETRARLAHLFATVPSDATILAAWTPGMAFRHPAWRHAILHEEIIATIPAQEWHALAGGLAAGTIRPAAIDPHPGLPAEVLAAIRATYAPDGPFWRPRD